MKYSIIHHPKQYLFKTEIEQRTAFARYNLHDGCLDILQVNVPKPITGRGIASGLVKTAYDYAIANGLKPKATCPYAVIWLQRHPDYIR